MPRRPLGRVRARSPFDAVADRYDRVRPGYPDGAVDDLLELSGVPLCAQVLEVGAGTGQLSVALAERGHRLTAIELGPNLAERLRRNLRDYQVAVVCGRFEDVELPARAYDLVTAASAFQWLDHDVAYPRAADLLRPTGALGLLFNLHVDRDDGFFGASKEVYARHAPALVGHNVSAELEQHDHWRREIGASGRFGQIEFRHHPWAASYSAAGYLELLSTYSTHIALESDVRERLFVELDELIERRFRGRVDKHYDALVVVARVRPDSVG